jgi:D-aspartate ligase
VHRSRRDVRGDRDRKKPFAVVLGLGQNGMATTRALGRAGIPVIGIDGDLTQPSALTRYASKVRCPDFEGGGPALLDCLLQMGRRLDDKAVLFPSGDMNLTLISEHREALGDYYHVALPSKDVVRMFLDKKAFYQFAMDRGFPIPKSFFPAGPEAIGDIARQIAYPCLVKPYYLTIQALERAHIAYKEIEPAYLAPADARAAFERGAVDA